MYNSLSILLYYFFPRSITSWLDIRRVCVVPKSDFHGFKELKRVHKIKIQIIYFGKE